MRHIVGDYVWRLSGRPFNVEVYTVSDEAGVPILFAPFRRERTTGVYRLLYAVNGAEYADFIYAEDLKEESLRAALAMLLKALQGRVELIWMPDGRTKETLSLLGYSPIGTYENAVIDLRKLSDHTAYIASLSKNARQNYRTAYNRLSKDGHRVSLEVLRCPDKALFSRMIDLYQHRHTEKYGISASWLKGFYLKHFNYSSRSLLRNDEALHAVLWIDGNLAAFCSGYLRGKRYFIPRLSINSSFKYYSPGILLLNELTQYAFQTGIIDQIDLGLGTEKYKLQMGAEVRLSYRYVIGE